MTLGRGRSHVGRSDAVMTRCAAGGILTLPVVASALPGSCGMHRHRRRHLDYPKQSAWMISIRLVCVHMLAVFNLGRSSNWLTHAT